MNALIAFPTTRSGPRAWAAIGTTRRHRERGQWRRLGALAFTVAVLVGLLLGLLDGASGRPLGDPGPATGPQPGLLDIVPISPLAWDAAG